MLDCSAWTSDDAFVTAFQKAATRERIPLRGSFNLTHLCNLDCIHCYVGPQADARRKSGSELNTEDWLRIIDEVAEAGCLYLLLTGGDPLLRRDFPEIYERAVRAGMLVTVFTNGTLVTKRLLRLFQAYPPQCVEMTIYGATPRTHDGVTARVGSFDKCLKGIRTLLGAGVRVKLKAMLMTSNSDEFADIRRIASDFGVRFRFDAAFFPRLNGDKSPLGFRVPAAEAIQAEFSDPKLARQWTDYLGRAERLPTRDELYQCGAGLTTFHVDAFGRLFPCLLSTNPEYAYDLRAGRFSEGWSTTIARLREVKVSSEYRCHQCDNRFLCGLCPAFSRIEGSDEEHVSSYLCSLGQLRRQTISEPNILKEAV